MEKFKDYSNQKFGRLQPLKRLYVKNHKTYWLCKCDCGNIIEKPISYLISGNCKSSTYNQDTNTYTASSFCDADV